MGGGPVRLAANKVSASKEIFMGLGLGVAFGMVWRSWHISYKASVDDFYKGYDAAQAAKKDDGTIKKISE